MLGVRSRERYLFRIRMFDAPFGHAFCHDYWDSYMWDRRAEWLLATRYSASVQFVIRTNLQLQNMNYRPLLLPSHSLCFREVITPLSNILSFKSSANAAIPYTPLSIHFMFASSYCPLYIIDFDGIKPTEVITRQSLGVARWANSQDSKREPYKATNMIIKCCLLRTHHLFTDSCAAENKISILLESRSSWYFILNEGWN